MFNKYKNHVLDDNDVNISILLKSANDIYDNCKYVVHRETELNHKIEKHIVKAVKKYPSNYYIKLLVYLPADNLKTSSDDIRRIIHNHFYVKAKEVEYFEKQQFKQWRINMLIGVLFLTLCLVAVEVLNAFSHINIIGIVKESLMIVGWVALWDPLTFILFGWQSAKKDKQYYRKLSCIPVKMIGVVSRKGLQKEVK